MNDLVKSGNFPIATMMFGGGLPPTPRPRKNNPIGRALTNFELKQILKAQTLKADIVEQFDREQEIQQDFVIRQITANQRTKTILAELGARETIASSKADEAVLELMDKKLKFKLNKKQLEALLDEETADR